MTALAWVGSRKAASAIGVLAILLTPGWVVQSVPVLPVVCDGVLGCEAFAARYDGPGHDWDFAYAVATSPDGSRVFMTGMSAGASTSFDFVTIAYNAATSAPIWTMRLDGPASKSDAAYGLAVSPDGARVFVTGHVTVSTLVAGTPVLHGDYGTAAYNATDGTLLWFATYNSPGTLDASDGASAIGVSPDGTRVFVTGHSEGLEAPCGGCGSDMATLAYDAATGALLWSARFNGPDHRIDEGRALAVTSDGSRVVVTGESFTLADGDDYVTLAYDAATGALAWQARYDGPAHGSDRPVAVAADPGAGRVFVTGSSAGTSTDVATVAYDAATGVALWTARFDGAAGGADAGVDVVAGAGRVFVTGSTTGLVSFRDLATLAYDAATGSPLWTATFNGPRNNDDDPVGVALRPNGGQVYATGATEGPLASDDYTTLAYDAGTGLPLWTVRYDGPASGSDRPHGLVVTADGVRLYVAGTSETTQQPFLAGLDAAVVGYDLGPL